MRRRSVSRCALAPAILAIALSSCQRSRRAETTPELIHDLSSQQRSRARADAARILGERKAARAVPMLITALKKDYPDPVGISAARALGNIKDARAVPPLIGILADFNPLLREAAARSLGELKDSRAVGPLLAAMKAGNTEAGPALAQIGEPAVGPLIDSLRDADTRAPAIDALVTVGKPAALPLIQAFKSNNGDARMAAAQVLAQINDPQAEQTLSAALQDGNVRLAAVAYKFLLRTRAPNSQELLVKALREYGNLRMAEDFLLSGRPPLKIAAQNWARENSYPIEVVQDAGAPHGPRR